MNDISIETICQELCSFIRSSIIDKNVAIEPDTKFSQIGIDSLSIIELVLFVERKFNVALPEEDLLPENFQSVKTLAQCTHRHLSK